MCGLAPPLSQEEGLQKSLWASRPHYAGEDAGKKSPYMATAMITMYVKRGMLAEAREVLEELPTRCVAVWNALIAGYADQRQVLEAFSCFERMQGEAIAPDAITFISILKVCGRTRAVCKGIQIHDIILNRGLLKKDIILGNVLVDMYAKCGMLARAHRVLKELTVRDVFSWSALIAGYAKHGQAYEALNCFQQMQTEGLSPNSVTFICILKACSCIGSIDMGTQIHEEIVNRGLLEKDIMLGTALIDMYAKSGALEKAQEVLDQLSVRDVVSWSTLIAGYSEQGRVHEVMNCFEQMQHEGLSPDAVTFICILKACGSKMAIEKGRQVHMEIACRELLEKNTMLGNALVDMYAKCGVLVKAQQVFEDLEVRDIVTWNALITGFAQEGQCDEALHYFEGMQKEGFSPNGVTFICILKACANTGAIDKGEQIHEMIASEGLLQKDAVLANALLDMYVKCGMLAKAQKVFEDLRVRDAICWNALIAGYTEQGEADEALKCYKQMQSEGVSPNVVTFICILKACGSIRAADKGKAVHKEIESSSLLEADISVGNALVDMYSRCGLLAKAEEVLNGLVVRDVVSWNALLTGYVQEGHAEEALCCFDKMQREGLSPDVVTLICILKACCSIGAIDRGKRIHNEIVNRGLLERDIVLGNALVDMYAKCGLHSKARRVLEELPIQDSGSWNALIASYARQGQGHEALHCYEQMQRKGICPDVITFICILKAFGSTGAIDKAKQIHSEIVHRGLLENHIVLGNALIDMYAKFGMLGKAREVLKGLPARDAVSWNALIAGYAQQGEVHEALNCFEWMQSEGLTPDETTLLCVLSACSHSGLLNEAERIFGDMHRKYRVTPNTAHHTCMVVIFGGAGYFEKAISVIKVMPFIDDPAVWVALLWACRKWGNVKLGRLIFDQAIQLDSSCSAAYVHMANIFAAAGMQEDAEKVESMRLKFAAGKTQGDV